MTIDGMTVMVPVHTAPSFTSPYVVEKPDQCGRSSVRRDGMALGEVTFPMRPRFYDRSTADGIPFWKIAVLHGRDVLATTVLQTCVRYQSRTKTCQFCAIGQSLAAGRTVERKTPAQLAEVARAAVELDGVKHMVMTTGTPPGRDRGAAILAESAAAVKAAVDLPIQGQCEPPDNDLWFARMRDSGVDALGMHLELITPELRARIMPGKAQVPVERYFHAFAAAIPVFGRGQVSTYILAGLGDTKEAILATCERLIALGVYPFVVPFVPISGTPLESHPAPSPAFMHEVLAPLALMLREGGLSAADTKAGCGRCGACSALATYEREAVA
jgi:radical SAM protein (TIGR04043 family)